MSRDVPLRVVLLQPPAGVDIGVQKGRGSKYETVQTQRTAGNDLTFEFTIRVVVDADTREPNFSGPFVQGPPGGRFIYLDIGTTAGQADTPWARRLKIPLGGITREMVDRAAVLETHVRGTGRDGGPSCGTVKPFGGWRTT